MELRQWEESLDILPALCDARGHEERKSRLLFKFKTDSPRRPFELKISFFSEKSSCFSLIGRNCPPRTFGYADRPAYFKPWNRINFKRFLHRRRQKLPDCKIFIFNLLQKNIWDVNVIKFSGLDAVFWAGFFGFMRLHGVVRKCGRPGFNEGSRYESRTLTVIL